MGRSCGLPPAPRSDEDHQSTPDDHRRFGEAGPRRVPSVFVGAAPNADDSHNDVGKRKEMETDGDSVGQAGEDRSDGGRRRQNTGDGAIGDGVVPKGLAERKIAAPKRYQCVSHDARAPTNDQLPEETFLQTVPQRFQSPSRLPEAAGRLKQGRI